MKVLHINQKNANGGAVKIAVSLVDGLLDQHIDSELWYFTKSGNHGCTSQPIYPWLEKLQNIRIFEKIFQKCFRLNKLYRGDVAQPFFGSVIKKVYKWNPDIIHLHNLHGGWVDLKSIARLSKDFRIVFTLHDEWILTGHCGSTLECTGWKSGCLECPFLDRYVQIKRPITDGLRKEKEKFLNILAKNNAILVSPSKWLKERIIASNVWKGKGVVIIANGINLEPFHYLEDNKSKLRKELCLPINEVLLFFVAEAGSQNVLKFSAVYDMLNMQKNYDKKFTIVVAGDDILQREVTKINSITVIKVGYLSSEELLKYYSVVDLFLYPTKADSFGLVIAEAMASELPVLTTDVDAIPELIENEITGVLVEKDNSEMLLQAVNDFLNKKHDYKKMGKAARERIFEYYGLELMVNNYLKLYKEITGKD